MASGGKAASFASLHVPGEPLILYNVWDAGSARIVAEAGAKAIATGSASVAAANGYGDGQQVPLQLVLDNAERIVKAVDLPVTVDFEGCYGVAPDEVMRNVSLLASTGAVGCNFEDQVVGGEGLHRTEFQAERIRAARGATFPAFFINARTDIFLKSRDHDEAMAEAAIERARAYAEAGASGFFVPGLADLELLARICEASPIPVNFMAFPGAPTAAEMAKAGVARISHGPFPYKLAMKALKDGAAEALG